MTTPDTSAGSSAADFTAPADSDQGTVTPDVVSEPAVEDGLSAAADEDYGPATAVARRSFRALTDSAMTAPAVVSSIDAESLSDDDAATMAYLAQTVAPTVKSAAAPTSGLLTPQQVIAQIQAQINSTIDNITKQVTTCLCGAITQVQMFVKSVGDAINGATTLTAGTETGSPQGLQTLAWAVMAWVRKQAEYAVAAFNRSPVGVFLREVGSQITNFLVGLANSPPIRAISTAVSAFLLQCEDSTELPADLARTVLISGLNEPTDFEFITADGNPDQIEQILITEKSGEVKSYDMLTGTLTTLVKVDDVTTGGERGLLGIAVDPNFSNEGQIGYHTIYLAYTNGQNHDQLSRFTFSDDGVSEEKLVESTEFAQQNHHGGELEFDPSGQHLYWAVGNNGEDNSQNLTNIHGKILRLNRDGTPATDNPFIGSPNEITRLIYAYGLRNPFRFDFAPDGTLLAGDVGEITWEELNVVVPGGNYGWPFAEGACSNCASINPLYAYRHSALTGTGSITSVLVYTDDKLGEQYQDKVFIGDYSLGWIKELTVDSQYKSVISERTLDSAAGAVVKLAQGPDGNIYQLNIYPGQLMVIAPSGGNRAPTAVITASQTSAAADSLTVDFSAAGSSDPDSADTLTYHWDFGNGQTSTAVAPTMTFTKDAGDAYTSYTVTLQVGDGKTSNQTTQRIVVGSTPPSATIMVNESTYDAGDTITFSAVATDDQDGTLPAGAYNWTIEFRHLDHKHPFLSGITGTTGTMTVPRNTDQLDSTFYRITLTVTDSTGLSTSQFVDVHPNLVTLTVNASDPDATFTLDGMPREGSYTEQAVVGVIRTLGANSPQTVDGQQLVFGSWSDGGAASHTFTVGDTDATYTVTYLPVGV